MESQMKTMTPTATSAHQQRVDEMMARVRAEATPSRPTLFKPAPARPQRSSSTIDLRIAEEVDYVRRHLEMLGTTLAGDPILLHRHGTSLQSVDLMNQLLGHLARVIESEDKAAAAQLVSHGDLRSRLMRKSLVA
jgi:hypothetical protein